MRARQARQFADRVRAGPVVLAPVTVGLARWGATAYVVHEMQTAVAQGAAFAATAPLSLAGPDAEFERQARNVVLYGNAAGGERPRIPGLNAADIQVTIGREGGIPRSVEVGVGGYEGPGGVVRLEAGPRVSLPYRGRIAGF